MEFQSIKDILEFAISKEQASVQFYRDLAAQMTNTPTQALFETLVKNEERHIELLMLEVRKLGYTVDNEHEPPEPAYKWKERLEMDDAARDMTFVEALVLAIQKERAAFRLYAQLYGAAENEEFDKVMMELAEEEMRHVLKLEREYEAITHHRD